MENIIFNKLVAAIFSTKVLF